MRGMQAVVSLMFVTTIIGGCATHGALGPTNGRVPNTDDEIGSIAANVWYVPGRALLCGFGAVSAGVILTLTLGQSYEKASQLMHGGCSGPWTVDASGIRQAVP
jgi:hypothetical protein